MSESYVEHYYIRIKNAEIGTVSMSISIVWKILLIAFCIIEYQLLVRNWKNSKWLLKLNNIDKISVSCMAEFINIGATPLSLFHILYKKKNLRRQLTIPALFIMLTYILLHIGCELTLLSVDSFNTTALINGMIDTFSDASDFYSSINKDNNSYVIDDQKRAILAKGGDANGVSITQSGFLVPSSLLSKGAYNQSVLGVGFFPTCKSVKKDLIKDGYITLNETGFFILKGFSFGNIQPPTYITPSVKGSNIKVYPKLYVYQQSRFEIVNQGLDSNGNLLIDGLLVTTAKNGDPSDNDWYPIELPLNKVQANTAEAYFNNSIFAISCSFQSGIFRIPLSQNTLKNDQLLSTSKMLQEETSSFNSLSQYLSKNQLMKVDWLDKTSLPISWRNKNFVVDKANFQNYLMRAAAMYLGASLKPNMEHRYIKQTLGVETVSETFVVFSAVQFVIIPLVLILLCFVVFISTAYKNTVLSQKEKELLLNEQCYLLSLSKLFEHFEELHTSERNTDSNQ
ncbi:hypothetical protein HDU92_005920 [Lobulomyces angularis]|nr:hypothetical protein HDU92_005920 [Lobulomyces angularis]